MKAPTDRVALFSAIRGFALARSRSLLMREFVRRGWRVIAATVDDDYARSLEDLGVERVTIPYARGGLSPKRDLSAQIALTRAYRKFRPTLIHHFQAKPIFFGSLAAQLLPSATVVNTITGLGHAFIEGGRSRKFIEAGYRLLLKRSVVTVFQNPDDQQLFLDNRWIDASRARLIIGSGVDVEKFRPPTELRVSPAPRVLMVGRMLWQKGIREYIEAAEQVRKAHPEVRFQLAGEWDPEHPDAVDPGWIDQMVERGIIEHLGYVNDIEERLRDIDIFVLPSYREGVPRVVLEAGACAVPVVTIDGPGCRETVEEGVTGLLVPPRDSTRLAQALTTLIEDMPLRQRMGAAARERVVREFDVNVITERYLDLYREVGMDI